MKYLVLLASMVISFLSNAQPGKQWLQYEGKSGPGKGKHIVFLSGDEEYRSEEALPLMAKILAEQHGFKCTVLFAIDPKTGEVNPNEQTNIPGIELLQTADLAFMMLRFRELPDDKMKFIDDYLQAGKPLIALRTSTHAFSYSRNKQSKYAKYSYNSKQEGWIDGFGKKYLGETWVAHHGHHAKEGTRALINGTEAKHSILKGVKDIWGETDVYTIRELPADARILLYGQITLGMTPDAPLSTDKAIMPIAWVRDLPNKNGPSTRIFASTLGTAVEFKRDDMRRLLVNAVYWTLRLDEQINEQLSITIPGKYEPTMFGFGTHRKGLKPIDLEVK